MKDGSVIPVRRPADARVAAAASVFLAAAAIDLATMNRTVGLVDRGELAAIATTLGIAHPTGYPTLTLLGHVWVGLLPLEPALALNLLAALWAAAGAGLLTLLYDQVLARVAGAGGGPAPAPGPRAALAAIGALLTALTGVWWGQAGGFSARFQGCVPRTVHELLHPGVGDTGHGQYYYGPAGADDRAGARAAIEHWRARISLRAG